MTEVVSVKFNYNNKYYYFDPNGVEPEAGDKLIVETAKGLDLGECAAARHFVDDGKVVQPLRPIIRVATERDLETLEQNKAKGKEAFAICKRKIAEHGLDMKLVDVECSFDNSKILFFFTSEGRVDFRELVKDLAAVFRTRIELRQIGVRDETKMLGGIGICGRAYCCNRFLKEFEPVSTKMAKTQSMSLNPAKISGSCGRLMCCLRYEQEGYEQLIKTVPNVGAFVQTVGGYGNVVQTNVLRQKVKVRIDGDVDNQIKTYDTEQVAAVPGGRPKPGEELPDVLVYVEKKPEPEELGVDPWEAPVLFVDEKEKKIGAPGTWIKNPKPANRNRRRSNQQKKSQQAKPELKKSPAQPVKKKSLEPQENPVQKNANPRKRRKPRPRNPQNPKPKE